MKILVCANSDMGLYKFRKELLYELLKENEVYIALPNGEFIEKMKDMGCRYIPFEFDRRGMNPVKDIFQIFRYVKVIKNLDPDVVLTYTVKPNIYCSIASRFCKKPHISNVTGLGTAIENGGFLGKLTVRLYKTGLKKADCVFFQNSGNMEMFRKKKIVKGRARLLPGSGVNISENCFEEYPPESDDTRFLFIGRIMKDKGIVELLEAMEKIHNKYPKTRLDIVGECDEDYSGLLSKHTEKGYVFFNGLQNDVHSFIKASHCTVLPSYHEGMSNVLLETESTGRPVIASRVPGCRETFEEDITGIGCEANDTDSLFEAMEKFICLPYAKKAEMGKAGRRKTENEFDRAIVLDAYKDEIKKATE